MLQEAAAVSERALRLVLPRRAVRACIVLFMLLSASMPPGPCPSPCRAEAADPADVLGARVPVGGFTPSDQLRRPDGLIVCDVDSSIYSLPYIEARIHFKLDDGDIAAGTRPVTRLLFMVKMVDHSPGLDMHSRADVLLFRDKAFPCGEREEWELVAEKHAEATSRGRLKGRVRRGDVLEGGEALAFEVPLDYKRPVVRLKAVVKALVRSNVKISEEKETRTFILAAPPRWGGRDHVHKALLELLLTAHRRKEAAAGVLDAAYSLRSEDRPGAAALTSSLRVPRTRRSDPLLNLTELWRRYTDELPSDDTLEAACRRVLDECAALAGLPPLPRMSSDRTILGTRKSTGRYCAAMLDLIDRIRLDLPYARSRPTMEVVPSIFERARLEAVLRRTILSLSEQERLLLSCWTCDDAAELQGRLEKLADVAGRRKDELTRNLRAMKDLIAYGRGGWTPLRGTEALEIVKSLEKKRLTRLEPNERELVVNFARLAFMHLLEERYLSSVEAALFSKAAESLEPVLPTVSLKPPVRTRLPELELTVGAQTAFTYPSEPAEYSFRLRNLSGRTRHVAIAETLPPPSGWISALSAEDLLLEPGRSATVTYRVAPPFYAREGERAHGTLRFYFADDPACFHEVDLVTTCSFGRGRDSSGGGARAASVAVRLEKRKRTIAPGGVADFPVRVKLKGEGKALVALKVLSDVPAGWIVKVHPLRAWMAPSQERIFHVKVASPLYLKNDRKLQLILGVGVESEFSRLERIRITTVAAGVKTRRSNPVVNGGVERTYFCRPSTCSTIRFVVSNEGNRSDTFDLFLAPPPRGWYARLSSSTLALAPGEKKEVEMEVQPASTAVAGDTVTFRVDAVSVGRPEIRGSGLLRITVAGDRRLVMKPAAETVRTAPGETRPLVVSVENKTGRTLRLSFAHSRYCPHPEWLRMDEPLRPLEDGATRMVYAKLRVPREVEIGTTFPVYISALNERGDEICAARTEVVVARRHAVSLTLDGKGMKRSRAMIVCPIVVRNEGTGPDKFALLLRDGKRRWWARLSRARVRLDEGEECTVHLYVKIPPEARKDGREAVIEVQAVSLKDSSASDSVEVVVKPTPR